MADLIQSPLILAGEAWQDFGLVDSGHGRKFERYGPYRFIRPEPQAMWQPRLTHWDAHGEFVPASDEDGGGRWVFDRAVPREGWPLAWREVGFTAHCTPFRHLGFFPDMVPVWEWMRQMLDGRNDAATLNLFGYTGVGTLTLSRFGPVTHVDASKKAVAQARENAALSGMAARPIRWLIDDTSKFAARELRRGRRYGGIILDPPKFGRGPEGEAWRLEEHLPALVADCRQLLDAESRFLFLTAYAVRMSSLSLAGLLAECFVDMPGEIEHGELALREEGEGARLLPTAIFARWRNG
ncbi:MAG: class I SAM-dependent methyltransferase [Novosphingobium sp.]